MLKAILMMLFLLLGSVLAFRGGNGRPLFSVSSMDLAGFDQVNDNTRSYNYGRPLQTRFGRANIG
ncbi:unnamed protein product, partial [Mesorhabditis spiculigera]